MIVKVAIAWCALFVSVMAAPGDGLASSLFNQNVLSDRVARPWRGIPEIKATFTKRQHRTETEITTDHLKNYTASLKSFINETAFDVLSFESRMAGLKQELAAIGGSVKNAPPSPSNQQSYSFARRMFMVMEGAIVPLKTFNTEKHAHVWLYKIVDLNVRLMAMYNWQGLLDTDVENYSDKLLRFHHSVYFYKRKYGELRDSPDMLPHMEHMFNSVAAEAQRVIDDLSGQIRIPVELMT